MKEKKYYLGLDVGTDSVGYAACDEEYNLFKFKGEPAWGSVIFDSADLNAERRGFRSARRRLDRRQARVDFLQELFAPEISKIDERFYIRLQESGLWRDDTPDRYIFFNDPDYTDKDYFKKYPTIHHLIVELMTDSTPHDVRLVYLACAWLVAHRGHFLSNVNEDNIDAIRDFKKVYDDLIGFFTANEYAEPWGALDADWTDKLAECLKEKNGISVKNKRLAEILLKGTKPSKESREDFPFSQEAIIKLLAGGQCKPKDIFSNEDYEEVKSISLGMSEDDYAEVATALGDDFDLIESLRKLYDWSVLADSLGNYSTISESKVAIYDQHKKDLAALKRIIKKYCKDKYREVFREIGKENYSAYTLHSDEKDASKLKGTNITNFSKFLLKTLDKVAPDPEDKDLYDSMITRIKEERFLPKQKDVDNRVIPHQLYLYELKRVLKEASGYLQFLLQKDADGLTVSDKVISIFKYKLPYFVGPLNTNSEFSWLYRKQGKITPWNYEEMIDFEKSEEEFIRRMRNMCSYLPGETVLPKDSLCYHRFTVLNELNNLRINGQKISVSQKQEIFEGLFEKKKKVTRRTLEEFCISNNYISKGDETLISGIDGDFKSNLSTQIAFRRFIEADILSEIEVEDIINWASFAEDKQRFKNWLKRNYSKLSDDDIQYIASIRIKDFGRLSKRFLTEIEGIDKSTGEAMTILGAMWNTNNNLMELLSEKYTFKENIDDIRAVYYSDHKMSLNDKLDEMYVSNAVKRPIFRSLDIVKDLNKAFGKPEKIFIEMTRGGTEDQKGKRTQSRYQQLMDLYTKCRDEDIRLIKAQLSSMGESVDSRLQSEKLFLYFLQFGKCAYSGVAIDIEELMSGSKNYDVDHIYPQAYVKDDSIINNKVLVLSKINGAKQDKYPIEADIRKRMHATWEYWHNIGTLSDEKFKRLTRSTGFSDEEKYGFINRQIVETSQSTKAIAELLKERFPDAEIVYTKARLTSEFRQEYDIYKSRTYNDLHHAVDAYLNIVTGNVYNSRFNRKYFNINEKYSVRTKSLFEHKVSIGNSVVWEPETMKEKVITTARKNTAHFVKYQFFKTGGLFDQMPVKKAEGLVPRKKGLPTEKYGGYNKAGAMFYIPVKYKAGKKNEVIIMSVELLYGKHFLEDEEFAKDYSFDRLKAILGKPVEEVSFPMGMHPWKVNTVLSLDGFRVCITGIGSGGKCLSAQPIMQFSDDSFWNYYIKKLEAFCEKRKNNDKLIYDKEYDKVSEEDNIKLFDLYVYKLQKTIYCKRINNPLDTLINGRDKFIKLSVQEQAKTLLNIHSVFGRMTGGCDLSLIGGGSHSGATVNFSSTVLNWSKNYSDVRLVYQSPSGLWEKQSDNLLDLI